MDSAKRIKVAIGLKNENSVVQTHMGDAENFYIYDLFQDGTLNFIEKRKNTAISIDETHGAIDKMNAVVSILNDSDVVIGKNISPNFKNIAAKTNIQPVVVKVDEVSDIMKKVLEFFDDIYCLVEQRKQGLRPSTIPTFGVVD